MLPEPHIKTHKHRCRPPPRNKYIPHEPTPSAPSLYIRHVSGLVQHACRISACLPATKHLISPMSRPLQLSHYPTYIYPPFSCSPPYLLFLSCLHSSLHNLPSFPRLIYLSPLFPYVLTASSLQTPFTSFLAGVKSVLRMVNKDGMCVRGSPSSWNVCLASRQPVKHMSFMDV